MAGTDPRMLALQFFTQRGYTPAQAAGIVGNLVQESGPGLNTRAIHDGGTGLGVLPGSRSICEDHYKHATVQLFTPQLPKFLSFLILHIQNANHLGYL